MEDFDLDSDEEVTASAKVPNFSQYETDLLESLIEKHSDVLSKRSKKKEVQSQKDTVWIEIHKTFISDSQTQHRSLEGLKKKLKNMVNKAKKDYTNAKFEARKTGGGKLKNDLPPEAPRLTSLLKNDLEPLANNFDSELAGQKETKQHDNEVEHVPVKKKKSHSSNPAKIDHEASIAFEISSKIELEKLLLQKQIANEDLRTIYWRNKIAQQQTDEVLLAKDSYTITQLD